MFDQASELRQLVSQAARHRIEECAALNIISIAGGQLGVGCSTIALNLATELTRQGNRVLLVDADFHGNNLLSSIINNSEFGLVSVLLKEKTIHEVISTGPLGMQILPLGHKKPKFEVTREMHQSLIETFRQMKEYVDFIILDVGSESQATIRRFWFSSHLVYLITTPDDQVIMDSYAMIKTLIAGHGIDSLRTLVNKSEDEEVANEVTNRMARVCQRFLGYQLQSAGHITVQDFSAECYSSKEPWVISHPRSSLAQSIHELSKRTLALLEHRVGKPRTENQATHLSRSLSVNSSEK